MSLPEKPESKYLAFIHKFYNNAIIPQLYDDSLSYSELLYRVLKSVNEIITRVNDVNEFLIEIDKLLKEVDKHIKETVTEVLTRFYNDGTLQEILQNVSTEFFENLRKDLEQAQIEFENKINETILKQSKEIEKNAQINDNGTISTHRLWRHLENTGQIDSYITSPTQCTMQGSCYYSRNGKIEVAIISGDKDRVNTGTELSTIRIYDYTSSKPKITHTNLPIGHGNSMCYVEESNGSYFYITPSTINHSTQTDKIIKINVATGALESKAFTGFNPYACCSDGKNVYVYDNASKYIYLLNWDNGTLESVVKPNLPTGTIQNFAKRNDVLYFLVGNSLCCIDFKTGVNLKNLGIPHISSEGFKLGELEAICCLSGKLYIFSASYLGSTSGLSQLVSHQLFQILGKNTTYSVNYNTLLRSQYMVLYVNGNLNYTCGPNGTETSPFATCQEAIDYFNGCGFAKALEIRLIGNDRYGMYISGFTCAIRGWNETYYIGGINASYGGNIILHNVHVFCSLTNIPACVDGVGYTLRCYADVAFYTNGTGQWQAVDNAINITLGSYYIPSTVSNATIRAVYSQNALS